MIYVATIEGPSPSGGRGLFVDEPVAEGQRVLTFEGPIVSWDEVVADGREHFAVPVGPDRYINIYGPQSLVNHSCDPTTGFSDEATLVARRGLPIGAEVTFDYSLVTTDGWTMECRCGSSLCRHHIGDYADLPEAVKERYRGLTPPWVLELQQ